jgi:hypothetical protein
MDLAALQAAVALFKDDLATAITSASYNGKAYANGQEAKNAAIRSGKPIARLHEVVKIDLRDALEARGLAPKIHPPIGSSSPELKITGFIKGKAQDVTVLFGDDEPIPEVLAEGPMKGETDAVGLAVSNRSIIVGVRSQVSSIDKNFDTLMERAFAEPLNLHLRLPLSVVGEVYLLPVVELHDDALKNNTVGFKNGFVKIERFLKTFLAISGRVTAADEPYKYERSALVLTDLRSDPPTIYASLDHLRDDGVVGNDVVLPDISSLMPQTFGQDLAETYLLRHN